MIGWRGWALLLVIILLGAWLRWTALASNGRFHSDEALFATFARRAALNGDWLLPGALDKPPLSIYAMALAMLPFTEARPDGLPDLTTRGGEIAARLPGALASLLLIPLVYVLARRLYADKFTALVPAALIAVSPFAVAYSATAFTDGLLLLWLTAALYAAVSQRWGWTGVGMALAFASKQQALFYLPLVLAFGFLTQGRRDAENAGEGRPDGSPLQKFFASFAPLRFNPSAPLPLRASALKFFIAFGIGVVTLFLWDAARGQPTGFFALGIANNDPARLIRSDELVPRLTAWATHMTTLLAPATIPFALAALLATPIRIVRLPRNRETLIDIVLITFALAYLLLHWLVAFSIYDRYLLLIVIPFMLLAGRGSLALLRWLARRLTAQELQFGALLFVGIIALTARDTAITRSTIGSYAPQNAGIDEAARYLNAQALGAIIYDHWVGWELDYYLGQWTDKRRVYYPTARTLADDALRQPDPAPRYFIAPRREAIRPWLDALTMAGFAPTLEWESSNFVVYRLAPP
jgi:hypothetical protein